MLDHVVQHARHVISPRQHNALPATCNDAVQQVLVLQRRKCMHDTGHKGAPAVPEHVGIQGRARVQMQRIAGTRTTQQLFPRVVKAQLASVFFRHHNLATPDAVVDRRQVRLIKVSAIVHTTQIALVVSRRHTTRDLWIVQVSIEHDNTVG